MSRIEPLRREVVPEHKDMFAMVEAGMGFLPDSILTMARKPGLVEAFVGLAGLIQLQNTLEPGLARMVSYVVSRSAGCQYCQAHTHHGAAGAGIGEDKLDRIWDYETDPAFSEAERAALRVAQGAAQVPNAVSDADFAALKQHFSDEQILDIVAIIALFGFLNRWNDTLATELETSPLAHAEAHLAKSGWTVGKHA